MESIKRTKQNLKFITKEQDFTNLTNYSVNFENFNKNSEKKTTRLTKIQYLNTNFSKIKTPKEIKFPLETAIFNSQTELTKYLSEQKKSKLGFNKINSIVVLENKTLNNLQLNSESTYIAIKQDINSFIKPLSILNLNLTSKTN